MDYQPDMPYSRGKAVVKELAKENSDVRHYITVQEKRLTDLAKKNKEYQSVFDLIGKFIPKRFSNSTIIG